MSLPPTEGSLTSTFHPPKGCFAMSSCLWQATLASKWIVCEVYKKNSKENNACVNVNGFV